MDPSLNQGQTFQPNSSSGQAENGRGLFKRFKKVFLVLLLLAVVSTLGFVGFLTYQGRFNSNPAANNASDIPLGYQKIQDIVSKNKEFIAGVSIQAIFSGRLSKVEEGNIWVLEKDGKYFTINNSASSNIRYLRPSREFGKPAVSVGSKNIRIGEEVSILTLVDLNSGSTKVVSINAKDSLPTESNEEVPVSTPSATP